MARAIRVSQTPVNEADAYAREQWIGHNVDAGIKWDFYRGGLQAELEGEQVGAATFHLIGGVGHLGQIVVAHGRTGQGIGSEILRAFETLCRERDCHKLSLETAEWQARGFYEKHGWEVFHVLENDKFGRTWFLMHKRLA